MQDEQATGGVCISCSGSAPLNEEKKCENCGDGEKPAEGSEEMPSNSSEESSI